MLKTKSIPEICAWAQSREICWCSDLPDFATYYRIEHYVSSIAISESCFQVLRGTSFKAQFHNVNILHCVNVDLHV